MGAAAVDQAVWGREAKAQHDLARGVFVEPHKLALGEWLQTWLAEYKRPSVRDITFDSYAMIIRRHLTPALGHIPLRELRPEHVQHYQNEKAKQGLDARTIRLHHVILSNALLQAEKNGLVVRNVYRLVESPRQTRWEQRTLTVAQLTTQLLPTLQHDRLYAAYLTLFMTGLRRGELLGLRWQDVDLAAGVLQVRQAMSRVYDRDAAGPTKTTLLFAEPKTEKSRRTIPLPEACLASLRQHRARQAEERLLLGQAYQEHGLVFAQADGTPIDTRNMNLYFTQALKRAGLPPIRLHDARHTYATWLPEQGVSLKVVQTLLGHGSIAVTADVYSHVSLELEKQAAAKLNVALTAGLL
jgi:integrase